MSAPDDLPSVSRLALEIAVSMEIHAALSTTTRSKAQEIDHRITPMIEALRETLAIATRNEEGPWADRARAVLNAAEARS